MTWFYHMYRLGLQSLLSHCLQQGPTLYSLWLWFLQRWKVCSIFPFEEYVNHSGLNPGFFFSSIILTISGTIDDFWMRCGD